jgi:hypothetical protein
MTLPDAFWPEGEPDWDWPDTSWRLRRRYNLAFIYGRRFVPLEEEDVPSREEFASPAHDRLPLNGQTTGTPQNEVGRVQAQPARERDSGEALRPVRSYKRPCN